MDVNWCACGKQTEEGDLYCSYACREKEKAESEYLGLEMEPQPISTQSTVQFSDISSKLSFPIRLNSKIFTLGEEFEDLELEHNHQQGHHHHHHLHINQTPHHLQHTAKLEISAAALQEDFKERKGLPFRQELKFERRKARKHIAPYIQHQAQHQSFSRTYDVVPALVR